MDTMSVPETEMDRETLLYTLQAIFCQDLWVELSLSRSLLKSRLFIARVEEVIRKGSGNGQKVQGISAYYKRANATLICTILQAARRLHYCLTNNCPIAITTENNISNTSISHRRITCRKCSSAEFLELLSLGRKLTFLLLFLKGANNPLSVREEERSWEYN